MGVHVVLEVDGRAVTLDDPSGGTFSAAGDFDRLLPVRDAAFPVLSRVDPYGDAAIHRSDLAGLVSEVSVLLDRAADGPERRGLIRLQALALAGQGQHGAELRFTGD
jgi:hypothetical protein